MRPCILLLLLVCPFTLSAQSLQHRLDSLLEHYYRQGQLNGTVLVASKGKIAYSRQFGYSNRQFEIPVTKATRFPMASITKLFTAVLILQLQEEGRVKIDSPVSAYLPAILPSINRQITIRQLLLHTTGLPGDKVSDYYAKSIKRPGTFIRNTVKDTLLFQPGTRFNYNNVDYIVLGAIIEQVTGKKWGEQLQEKILSPLQLHNTGIIKQEEVIPKLAYGYHNYSFGQGTVSDTLYNDETPYFENYSTAGAIYTTADDLLQFDQALYNGTLLNPASVKLMYIPSTGLDIISIAGDTRPWVVTLTRWK